MIDTFLAAFMAGFLGVVVGVGTVAILFYQLYRKEQQIAKELSDKFLQAIQGDIPQPKKGQKVDFLSLIKTDKEPPVN